jgi:hypothetical protein
VVSSFAVCLNNRAGVRPPPPERRVLQWQFHTQRPANS